MSGKMVQPYSEDIILNMLKISGGIARGRTNRDNLVKNLEELFTDTYSHAESYFRVILVKVAGLEITA